MHGNNKPYSPLGILTSNAYVCVDTGILCAMHGPSMIEIYNSIIIITQDLVCLNRFLCQQHLYTLILCSSLSNPSHYISNKRMNDQHHHHYTRTNICMHVSTQYNKIHDYMRIALQPILECMESCLVRGRVYVLDSVAGTACAIEYISIFSLSYFLFCSMSTWPYVCVCVYYI